MTSSSPSVHPHPSDRPIPFEPKNARSYAKFIHGLVARGGPLPDEYPALDEWISNLYRALDRHEISHEVVDEVRKAMTPVLAAPTMHGFAYSKPHGYAGDFEIIDRHYLTYIVPDALLANWDHYWHAGPASTAVRNRKSYFCQLLRDFVAQQHGRSLRLLNLASGPARDVLEFLTNNKADITVTCVDRDPKAILYAAKVCQEYADRIEFRQANVIRFRPEGKFDLIWAAGLFDYFADRTFVFVLRRLLPFVAPGGKIVIGNFSTANPNLDWMRLCDWHLYHRTDEQLISLAGEAGAQRDLVHIEREPKGVNLFLHISR